MERLMEALHADVDAICDAAFSRGVSPGIVVIEKAEGRELDALVAERIFGWTGLEPAAYTPAGRQLCGTDPSGEGGFYGTGRRIVPKYSASVRDAWQVV